MGARSITLAGLLLAFFLAMGSPPAAAEPRKSPPGQDFVISLRRTVCFGRCPAYTVQITADGHVIFDGDRFVAQTGRHEARVSRAAVTQLRRLVETSGFMDLRSEYISRVTDIPSQTVTVTLHGRTHSVTEHGGERVGMPASVREIERAIDETAGVARWVRGPEPHP